MAFNLPDLPYAFDALEPIIDATTMEIHHDKHHAAYVNNLNAATEDTEWSMKDIREVVIGINSLPDDKKMAIRNNGGGHFNHSLFWQVMAPTGSDPVGPQGKLKAAIDADLGGLDKLKDTFNQAATTRFGSGWAWLGVQGGKLVVCSTPNQDNPLMKGLVECECEPILGLDVWEHAYYLKYQNRRPEYAENFWQAVNWAKVSENYEAALS
jgi:Fe-Mn family superoxide dismutase